MKHRTLGRRGALKLCGAAAGLIAGNGFAATGAAREFVIRNGYVLTLEPGIADLPKGDVHVRDGVIVAVGERIAAPGVPAVDATDRIVMPGFVDTHWHMWNTFLRGLVHADDPVRGYFPTTLRLGPFCRPEDAHASVRFSVAEAFLAGITTVHDWAHNIVSPAHADAELQTLTDAGIRARFSYGTPQDLAGDRQMDIGDIARVQKAWSRSDGMLSIGAAVRTPGNSSVVTRTPGGGARAKGVTALDMVASEIDALRKLGAPFTMHGGGKGTIAPLAGRGLLGRDLLMVHAQGMTPDELQAIAESGAGYSISPVIEMSYSAVRNGQIEFAELEARHVPLGLSLDSTGASANADFFAVMRALLWSQWRRTDTDIKLQYQPRRLVELATLEGARRLGVGEVTGSLKAGKRADIITVRTTDLNIAPMGDPYYALVFSAESANVDLVVANGRVVARAGALTTMDQGKVVQDAAAAAAAVVARGPKV